MKGRKGTKVKNKKVIVLSVLGLMVAFIAAGVFGVVTLCNSWLEDLPDYQNADAYNTAQPTMVYASDGTTLLGADDKAGIAAIVEMVARIQADPSIPHAKLCIGFTPDEEVARGTENFDIDAFGARYAYTFDGGEVGGLEYENFNGGTAWVTVSGVGVHPGSAKGKMVNSLRFLAKYVDRLPPEMSPECTSGHEGFLHPNHIEGSVVSSTVRILVRDHDRALYEAKKALLVRIADEMNAEFPQAKIEVRFKDSYENMKT